MLPLGVGSSGENSPVSRALGEDFRKLHAVVRRHYSEPAVKLDGVMDSVHVNPVIRPLALLSYLLFGAPLPRGGEDVKFTVHSHLDGSGTMHWRRIFFANPSFPRDACFVSHMVFSGDHRIIETTRLGLGFEASLSVDRVGGLVYEARIYVIGVPFLGLLVRVPTWLSPFGGGRTTETGEDNDNFRVEFEMPHPIFGRTVGYSGRCRIH